MEWSMGLNWGGGCPYWDSCILLGVQCKEHHPGLNSFTSHHEPLDHCRLNFGGLSSAIHHPTWWESQSCFATWCALDIKQEQSSLYQAFCIIQTVSVCCHTSQFSNQMLCDTCIFNLDGFSFLFFLLIFLVLCSVQACLAVLHMHITLSILPLSG